MARPKSLSALVPDVPDRLSDGELTRAFQGRTDVGIMRGLLEAELRYIRAGGERDTRTLRGLWYDQIKSALSRTGQLHRLTSKDKPIDWDGLLSDTLEDMVTDGTTTYEEMKILDGSRRRAPARSVTKSLESIELVGQHYPWLILFVEKDTIWPVVDDIASFFGVSVLSCSGEPSAACTENMIKDIIQLENYQGSLVALGLTDYDPHGYFIFDAQVGQIERFFPNVNVISKRIGVLPNQLTPEELQVKAYEPKSKGLMEWVKRTGGINGLPLGLELDALPIQRIRATFADEIMKHIDLEPRRADLRRTLISSLAWRIYLPSVEKMVDELVKQVESECGEDLQRADIPASLFRNAAIMGLDCLDPMKYQVFASELEVKIRKTLNEAAGV